MEEFIKHNRKLVELHVHLEGCIWQKHIEKWKNNAECMFPLVPTFIGKSKITFDEFLGLLRMGYNYLNGLDQYIDVLSDYLEYMEKHNIVYAEIQLNIALLNTFNIELEELLKAFKRIGRQYKGRYIRFIVDLPWQFSIKAFEFLLKDYDKYSSLGVVGLSMGGDESLAQPKEIASVFEHARNEGYKILCHAGETTTPSFARSIVNEINPDRIGHGLSLSKWMIGEQYRKFVVDTCLTSNVCLGLVKNIKKHPFYDWIKSPNIIATLSTDDPAIFDTTITDEYGLAEKHLDDFALYLDSLNDLFLSAAFDKESLVAALGV